MSASLPQDRRPFIGITMGDPSGVGPEVIAKSLARPDVHDRIRPVFIGDPARLRQAAAICGIELQVLPVQSVSAATFGTGRVACIVTGEIAPDLPFGCVSREAGESAYRCVVRAAELASAGEIDGICTAPLNKEALNAAGHSFAGHTELLAKLTGTPEVSMLLNAPGLRVIHVTTHIGLLDAVAKIEPGPVERTIRRGHDALVKMGIPKPRIAVCGINPHAGENGLFGGGEEAAKVTPGIERCRELGIDATGPWPADTLFYRARRGDFDLVVAMYHDQGHGPIKVLGLEAGVNVTVGLPFVRTSVDHGTAFDIAGTGRADEGSMVEALLQAATMVGSAGSRPGAAR